MSEITCRKVYCDIDRVGYPENTRVDVYEHEVPILEHMYGAENVMEVKEPVKKVIKDSGSKKPQPVRPVQKDYETEMTRMRDKYGPLYEQMVRTNLAPKPKP